MPGHALAILVLAVAALETAGQEAPALELDLDQAVRMTIERSPEIRRSWAEVSLREGRLREASGTFDSVFRLNTSGGYVETELDPDTLSQELQRRQGFFSVAQTYGQLQEELADRIANGQLQVPICPPGFSSLRITGQSGIELGLNQPICVPVGLGTDTPEGLVSRALQALFASPAKIDLTATMQQLRSSLGLDDDDRLEEIQQLGIEQLERAQRLASAITDGSVLALERLGHFPETEYRNTLAFQFKLDKPFRFGSLLSLQARFSGQERRYRGKPLDPSFGGAATENEFKTSFSLNFNQPLGKGRGSVAARAAELAAAARLEAARRRFEQACSQRVLDTVIAHTNLLAAQQSLALIEQSVQSNRSLLDATEALVKAGERARSEMSRSEARLAEAQSGAAAAGLSVLAARAELARVIGIDPGSAGVGPLARGAFPVALADPPDVDSLQQKAVLERRDLRAAEDEEKASSIIVDASQANLRRRIDLSLTVGMASDYRSPFFRVAPDEFASDPFEPPESPVDYYSPVGFWRSISNKYLPEVRAQITFDLPFGNNRARGRLEQDQASLRQGRVRTIDLGRVIRENVAGLFAALRSARAEVEQLRKSVGQHEENWKTTQELRSAGDLSLVDTLVTEQDLTNARLQLVEALRNYEISLARLRFEAGSLVQFHDGQPVSFDLVGLPSPS